MSKALIADVLGDQISVEGDAVTRAPRTGYRDCTIRAESGVFSYVRVHARVDAGPPPRPTKLPQRCTEERISGWGPVVACWSDGYVDLAAWPPEKGRFLVVDVRLQESTTNPDQDRKRTVRASLAIAKDVNRNLNALPD